MLELRQALQKTIMKTKTIISAVLLGACFSLSIPAFAQVKRVTSSATEVSTNEKNQQRNQDLLTQEKQQQNDTKAAAKEAWRINDEAAYAAKASRKAFNTEKKVQKMRKQADKQADKANAAIQKSKLN